MATATKTTKTEGTTEEANSTTTKTKKTPALRLALPKAQCQCHTTLLGYDDDGTPRFGACDGTTNRRYQQGHDARAKSTLLQLARAGVPYRMADADGNTTDHDAAALLAAAGWA